MRKEDFFEVLGELDDDMVKDARAVEKGKTALRRRWVRWAAAAMCMCLAAAGIFFYSHKSGDLPKTLSEQLEEYGLHAKTVNAPVLTVSGEERPETTKEDLLNIVRAGTVVTGKVRNSAYAEVKSGNEHWYIVQMTLEVSEVLSGAVDGSLVRAVSASVYYGDDEEIQGQFLIEETLLGCQDGAEGLFILRDIEEDAVWNIGGIDAAVRSLGDHMLIMRLDAENGQYTYNGIAITDDDISDG